jgi:mRNA interferase RelE/StbE
MKEVIWTVEAIRGLKRHGNMAVRIRKAIPDYAADPGAHANNVTRIVATYQRLARRLGVRIEDQLSH